MNKFLQYLLGGIAFFCIVVCCFIPQFLKVDSKSDSREGSVDCNKNAFMPDCVCPADERHIGKKNIIFIDATDKVPDGKKDDLYSLLSHMVLSKQGFWEWLVNGRKVNKTSIYILSDERPVDMEPFSTYCSLPPDFIQSWTAAGLEKKKKKKKKKN